MVLVKIQYDTIIVTILILIRYNNGYHTIRYDNGYNFGIDKIRYYTIMFKILVLILILIGIGFGKDVGRSVHNAADES